MKTYTINVTQEDIEHGEKLVCARCPVGLAMQRSGLDVQIWTNYPEKLSPTICKFMTDFDSSRPVQPFSFEITL